MLEAEVVDFWSHEGSWQAFGEAPPGPRRGRPWRLGGTGRLGKKGPEAPPGKGLKAQGPQNLKVWRRLKGPEAPGGPWRPLKAPATLQKSSSDFIREQGISAAHHRRWAAYAMSFRVLGFRV